jgi:chromosome segregation ATPase
MARGGITRTEVERARQALLARAENPSIDAIRIALGNTGSRTTIHRHLKAIEALEGTRLDDEALLSETLREMVATLARGLRTEAQGTIEANEQRHAAALAEREAALQQLHEELNAVRQQADQREAALQAERTDHAATRAALTEAKAQQREQASALAALTERLAEKDTVIASLEDKHRHARESLEHFRAAAQTQREQMARQHADQLQHLRAELRAEQQTLSVKQQALTTLNRDNARLVTELGDLQRRHRDLQDAHAQAEASREALAATNYQLKSDLARGAKELAESMAANETLEKQYEEARQAIAELQTQRLQRQAELEVQQALFERLEAQIAGLGDRS